MIALCVSARANDPEDEIKTNIAKSAFCLWVACLLTGCMNCHYFYVNDHYEGEGCDSAFLFEGPSNLSLYRKDVKSRRVRIWSFVLAFVDFDREIIFSGGRSQSGDWTQSNAVFYCDGNDYAVEITSEMIAAARESFGYDPGSKVCFLWLDAPPHADYIEIRVHENRMRRPEEKLGVPTDTYRLSLDEARSFANRVKQRHYLKRFEGCRYYTTRD